MLEQPRLLVEPFQCPQFLLPSEPGVTNGGLQHAYRLVVDAKRHGKRVPVLATVRERKSSRVGEAVWGSVHDLGDHGQRAHGTRSHAGSEQKLCEIGWAAIGGRSQIAVEPLRVHVAGANIVMLGKIEMRQEASAEGAGASAVGAGAASGNARTAGRARIATATAPAITRIGPVLMGAVSSVNPCDRVSAPSQRSDFPNNH